MNAFRDEMVSIIIPTYYRNELLQEAIESATRQQYSPLEILVVDDSGERYAEDIVEAYEAVTYIPLEENVGENRAREAGLAAANGQYVQFLDDDDLLREDKLTRQAPLLSRSTGVVYSGLRYHESGEVILPDPDVRGDVLEHTLKFEMWPPCFTSTLLVDRTVLEAVRPLRGHGAGDTTFMIGLAQRTDFEFVDAPLVEKRLDVDSLGFSLENVANKRALLEEYETLYDRYPACRSAALEQTHRQEGHVRLSNTRWSPHATVAFARAAYRSQSERAGLALTALGSVFGRPGVRATQLGRQFLNACREDGPWQAIKRGKQHIQSR